MGNILSISDTVNGEVGDQYLKDPSKEEMPMEEEAGTGVVEPLANGHAVNAANDLDIGEVFNPCNGSRLGSEMSVKERLFIVRLYDRKVSKATISQLTKRPQKAINEVIGLAGRTGLLKERTGTAKKQIDDKVVKLILQNPQMSTRTMKQQLERAGVKVGKTTIQNILKRNGINYDSNKNRWVQRASTPVKRRRNSAVNGSSAAGDGEVFNPFIDQDFLERKRVTSPNDLTPEEKLYIIRLYDRGVPKVEISMMAKTTNRNIAELIASVNETGLL